MENQSDYLINHPEIKQLIKDAKCYTLTKTSQLNFCDLSGSEKPTEYDEKKVEEKKIEEKKVVDKMTKRASVGIIKPMLDLTKLQ